MFKNQIFGGWLTLEVIISLLALSFVLYSKYNKKQTLYEKMIRNLCWADVGLELTFLTYDVNYLIFGIESFWLEITLEGCQSFCLFSSLAWVLMISYTVHQNITNPNFSIEEKYPIFVILCLVYSSLASVIGMYLEWNYYLYLSQPFIIGQDFTDIILLILMLTVLAYFYIYCLQKLQNLGYDTQLFCKQLLIYPVILIICYYPPLIVELLFIVKAVEYDSSTFYGLYAIFESLTQMVGLFDAIAYGWNNTVQQKQKSKLMSSFEVAIEINDELLKEELES